MIYKITQLFIISFLLISFISCTGEESEQTIDNAEEFELPADGIEIADAWARPGQEEGVSAIYMNILNGSSMADTLLSISSPVAGMVEIHETYEQEEGMMGMRPAEVVVAPARGALSLKPGGLHVMLMRLNRELREGDTVEFSLVFTSGEELTLTAPVEAMRR